MRARAISIGGGLVLLLSALGCPSEQRAGNAETASAAAAAPAPASPAPVTAPASPALAPGADGLTSATYHVAGMT